MRSCPQPPAPATHWRPAIETLILLVLAVAIAGSLVVLIGQLLVRRNRAREELERSGRTEPPPRTDEQKARDAQTSKIWGCIVLLIPAALVAVYVLTR